MSLSAYISNKIDEIEEDIVDVYGAIGIEFISRFQNHFRNITIQRYRMDLINELGLTASDYGSDSESNSDNDGVESFDINVFFDESEDDDEVE